MNEVVSDALIHALGWTLIHSLWQGALLGLALYLILPRLHTAVRRYWTAYGMLLALLLTAIGRFCFEYLKSVPSNTGISPVDAGGPVTGLFVMEGAADSPGFWPLMEQWLEAQYPVIVTIWLLGFGFFGLQLMGGLWHIRRLRRKGIRPVSTAWQQKAADLSARLSFSRPIALLESALVHAPMAMGHLKPLILFPVGLINQLSQAEVEAVLIHELAHIARRDWLFNLVQAFIEAVFYFHPVVWWMSGVIRTERENCCDDAAVRLTGNRILYVKALVQVQEMAKSAAIPALALGLDGNVSLLRRRPQLLERVRRVLNQSQPKSQIMEKFIATSILLGLMILVGIKANSTPALHDAFQKIMASPATLFDGSQAIAPPSDTVPEPKHRVRKITREEDDKKVELETRDGKITRLSIDGKDIPPAEYDQHRDLTSDLLQSPPTPPPPPPAPGFGFDYKTLDDASFMDMPHPVITSTNSGDGTTIIRIEKDGKPTEIKVKDGTVWIDDRKLSEGETRELPWNSFFKGADVHVDIPNFHFEMPEIPEIPEMHERPEMPEMPPMPPMHFNFSYTPDMHVKIDKKAWKEQEKEMKREWKTQEKEWKKQQREWKKQQKNWSNENAGSFQLAWSDAQRAQLEAERARSEVQRDAIRAQLDSERGRVQALREVARERDAALRGAQREQHRAMRESRTSDRSAESIRDALLQDKLISDPDHYSMQLNQKEMVINGVKQPDNIRDRYLELYLKSSGKPMKKGDVFNMTEEK
jgi:beta-lactamase regulating signal transducer with metallopeptidase domain